MSIYVFVEQAGGKATTDGRQVLQVGCVGRKVAAALLFD